MNKYLKLLLISITILFLLIYGLFVCVMYYANLRTPMYTFDMTMGMDRTLTNVTLIVPMPAREDRIIDLSRTNETRICYEEYNDWYNPTGWKGWNITITNTSHGPMMKLTKHRVTPPESLMDYHILPLIKRVNYPINGYDPFQNDILIRPRENHENPAKYQEKLQQEYEIPFSTYAYLSYDDSSEINADVDIGFELKVYTGTVEHESRYNGKWYIGSYSEGMRGSLNPGWNTLNGTTRVFVGQFRNVPGWLEILSLGTIH